MKLRAIILVAVLLSRSTALAQSGADALLESTKLGQLPRVKELISKGVDVNTVDRRGFTPLMWASASGSMDIVRQLIESGAAVNLRAKDGTTALMLSSANGFADVSRVLILRGADVMAARAGIRSRQFAIDRGHAEVVKLLDQAEALGGGLLKAAAEGNDTAVRQLLTAGAPVDVTDERGATPLMLAARNGDLGMLQALLSRGADASARDGAGKNVFDWAEPSPVTGKYVAAFLTDRGVSREARRGQSTRTPSPQVKVSLRAMGAVLARIPPASEAVRAALRRANGTLSKLEALSAKWPADSPEDYRDNLADDVSALEGALKTGDPDGLAATVSSVADDLETKLEHCISSGGRLGGSVIVRVRTVQGSDEIRSWQVFYMPRVFEAAANASPDLFPQLSSPTQETLVPGRYVMWVRDPASARLGERTVVKVGEGKKEILVDLPIPAAVTPPAVTPPAVRQ
jgi:hypothetical protein